MLADQKLVSTDTSASEESRCSELIEDYLDETLATPEIKLFEENFLVSPECLAQFK